MKLRYYQQNAITSTLEYLENEKGNPIVAMPTGTGKSVVIAGLIHTVLNRWPSLRILMATHVKELIEQNADKLRTMWSGVPLGLYSAGLKERNPHERIVYGGVASLVNDIPALGHRNLMLVDECHLIGPNADAQYHTLIRGLTATNPKLRVIGYTATKYRMGLGLLTNGDMFDAVCYDDTTLERFNQLIAEGFLSMLIPQPTEIEIDARGVLTSSNGDFVQAQAEERAMRVTREALQNAARFRYSRASWLVFAGGLKHAYQIKSILDELGISSTVVHSNNKEYPITGEERDRRIADFKAGKYQAIINYNILTTGFDHPPIDLIIMLRLTKSVPLWVQMLGRGTRPFEGDNYFPRKVNCIVLDYARNTTRLGPINDPVIPNKKGGGGGEAPIKICEHCGTYNHISARWCIGCGEQFEFAVNIKQEADTAELVRDIAPVYERFRVQGVYYNRHKSKASGMDTLCARYAVEGRIETFNQYVPIEHAGKARERAVDWWAMRSDKPCPATITDALEQTIDLRKPAVITVWTNAPKYPDIVRVDYE